ncbi:hypothetical protein D3C73_1606420 [compost metagenome]
MVMFKRLDRTVMSKPTFVSYCFSQVRSEFSSASIMIALSFSVKNGRSVTTFFNNTAELFALPIDAVKP